MDLPPRRPPLPHLLLAGTDTHAPPCGRCVCDTCRILMGVGVRRCRFSVTIHPQQDPMPRAMHTREGVLSSSACDTPLRLRHRHSHTGLPQCRSQTTRDLTPGGTRPHISWVLGCRRVAAACARRATHTRISSHTVALSCGLPVAFCSLPMGDAPRCREEEERAERGGGEVPAAMEKHQT